MKEMKLVTLAVPFFVFFIVIEIIYSIFKKKNFYRVNDAITSLSTGILRTSTDIFLGIIPLAFYNYFSTHIAIYTFPSDTFNFYTLKGILNYTWLLIFYDFLYYWFHRISHERNLFWGAHSVHHQSEDYNLTTALRQPFTYVFYIWIFDIPLAFLGVPTASFITVAAIDLLYQFWIHTQCISKMGWFEKVFVSPSHHRVHHGINDQYIDKNYGGTLILWDKLFSTFQEELDEEPVVYGVKNPPHSWNPFWMNFDVWKGMLYDFKHAKNFYEKIYVWFSRPGWHPSNLVDYYKDKVVSPRNFAKFHPKISNALSLYAVLHYVVCFFSISFILSQENKLSNLNLLLLCLPLWYTVFCIGKILEAELYKNFIYWEYSRIILTILIFMLVYILDPSSYWFLVDGNLISYFKNPIIFYGTEIFYVISFIYFFNATFVKHESVKL